MTHRKRQWFTALNHEQMAGHSGKIGLTETWTSSGRSLGLARLAIDKDVMDDYAKLGKPVQPVKLAIDKFAEHMHAGLHLEKLHHPKDDRVRTTRIDLQ
jgi:hypothetical protein